jgi:hypothetical protein
MPINPKGSVCFFAVTLILSLFSLTRTLRISGDSTEFRQMFLLVLLAYGTFSYFLGRSHENNILNIIPFLMLLLLSIWQAPIFSGWRTATAVLLMGLISLGSFFGWGLWRHAYISGRLLEFFPKRLQISFLHNYPEAAVRAIKYIEDTYAEPVTVLDFNMNPQVNPKLPITKKVWSAIHNPANFSFIPREKRRDFLKKTANTLKRAGWLVIERNFPANEWLEDFDSAYVRVDEKDFGSYYAIKFQPRLIDIIDK